MAKAFTIAALTVALTLAFLNTAQAAKTPAKDSKGETISGIAVQVTKSILIVEVQGDKVKRVPVQLTKDTTYTGGELVQGVTVNVTVKAGKATTVDVPMATK